MRTIFDIMKTPADVKEGDTIVAMSGKAEIAGHWHVTNMQLVTSLRGCRAVSYLTLPEAKELGWVQPLKDKDPVICWDNDGIGYRRIGFYDKNNNCVFYADGGRNGAEYNNYELLPLETAYIIFGGKDKYEEILNQLED